MIILLDTSTMTCRLTIVQGDTRQEVTWEAGCGLARGLLRFLDEQTGGIHHVSGIGIMRGQLYGTEDWLCGSKYVSGWTWYSDCWQ